LSKTNNLLPDFDQFRGPSLLTAEEVVAAGALHHQGGHFAVRLEQAAVVPGQPVGRLTELFNVRVELFFSKKKM
jgi:hypothetical protein